MKELLLEFQKGEITEHYIYENLVRVADTKNAKVLRRLSQDEVRHYGEWKKYSGQDVKPDRFKIFWYTVLSKLLGLTFVVKLMERGEQRAQEKYARTVKKYPATKKIIRDETEHERLLVEMIDEEKVKHIGSMVLGVNDALVEITGTLAGLTFALQNSQIVGLVGLITGISATLSMGASEYLSQRSEGREEALRAAGYTGAAYLLAVFFLVLPYFLLANPYAALGFAVIDALAIILVFTFFSSVIKEEEFKKRFFEMAAISLSVAAISFLIGLGVRNVLRISE